MPIKLGFGVFLNLGQVKQANRTLVFSTIVRYFFNNWFAVGLNVAKAPIVAEAA